MIKIIVQNIFSYLPNNHKIKSIKYTIIIKKSVKKQLHSIKSTFLNSFIIYFTLIIDKTFKFVSAIKSLFFFE